MRMFTALLIAAAAFAAPASAETRNHAGFDRVSAAGRVEVEVVVGGAFSVEIEGPRVERVDMRVRNGELVIETRRDGSWRNLGPGRDAHIRITMPSLTALDTSAGAELRAQDVNADAFSLDASSGSELSVSGRCGRMTMDVSSGASVRARDLRCQDVRLDASSGANATLFAEANFDIDASSGANVRWDGQARIRNVDLSSGASVRRLAH